jgi:hypothetical protein
LIKTWYFFLEIYQSLQMVSYAVNPISVITTLKSSFTWVSPKTQFVFAPLTRYSKVVVLGIRALALPVF